MYIYIKINYKLVSYILIIITYSTINCDKLGYPVDDKRPKRKLKIILNKLNIDPLNFHGLRHTYATRLFEAGVPPKTVQALMGHANIDVTMDIYTHVMEDTKLEAIEKLNNIFVM